MPPDRIAILTLAAPWERQPLICKFWLDIAQAFQRAGVVSEIFYLSMKSPRWVERFIPKFRLFNERPDDYVFAGVPFHTIRGYIPPIVPLRWKLSPRAPGFAAWLVSRGVRGELLRRVRAFDPTVLMIHDGILLGPLGREIAASLRVPYTVTEHDVMDLKPGSRLGSFYARQCRDSRATFTVHAPSARHLRERLGIASARLVHNGTLMPTEAQRRAPRPEKWRGRRIVLHVGAPIARKAHVETIRAFAEASVPNSTLVFIGPPLEEYRAAARASGVGDRIEFLGPMPHGEVLQHMCWADLFVLPSWWEAFGLVYTEAMASETPVIMCGDCGLAEFIKEDVHGWVIPPRNPGAITRALRHALTEANLEEMGRAGRALAESHWTWDESARTLLRGLRGEPDLMR